MVGNLDLFGNPLEEEAKPCVTIKPVSQVFVESEENNLAGQIAMRNPCTIYKESPTIAWCMNIR